MKVADFGLTRFISEKKQMTQVGTVSTRGRRVVLECAGLCVVWGSCTDIVLSPLCVVVVWQPMWMAPEIIMGRKYTEKADVYAFGIVSFPPLGSLSCSAVLQSAASGLTGCSLRVVSCFLVCVFPPLRFYGRF